MVPPALAESGERDLHLLEDLARQACSLEGKGVEGSERFAGLAIAYAEELLRLARDEEQASEVRARSALSELLEHPQNQLFSAALTDRIHRSGSADEAVQVLRELARRSGVGDELPSWDRIQLRAARMFGPLVPEMVKSAVMQRLHGEAAPYLWDAEPSQLQRNLRNRHREGLSVNVNHLGEEVFGRAEARERLKTYVRLAAHPSVDAVSVKLSGVESQIDLVDFDNTVARLEDSVGAILNSAKQRRTGTPLVYFDMEAYRDLGLTEALLHRLLAEQRYGSVPLGLAVQAYLPESLGAIRRLVASSERRVALGGVPLRVRLVKGANLHMERVEASTHRLSVPVFPSKSEVDANFKRTLRACIPHVEAGHLTLGVGSHNLFEIAYAALLRRRHGLQERIQFEMLEGMAGPIGRVLCQAEGGLLIYAPAVEEKHFSSAVSYLVRRLDENTAPENFLKVLPAMSPGDESFRKQAQAFSVALSGSSTKSVETFRTQSRPAIEAGAPSGFELDAPFDNAAETDFTRAENRAWLRNHRDNVSSSVGSISVGPIVAAQNPTVVESRDGFDPSRPQVSYRVDWASEQTVRSAIDAAVEAQKHWVARPRQERARLLFSLGDALERNRGRLIAAMTLDAGKRAQEADVEVSEAVDFARFYAQAGKNLGTECAALGVVSVIPPWNFPLAIPLGGVLAALAAGNAALLKPAPETPWVAHLATQICHDAGVPRELLQFLPCLDRDAAPLVQDERVEAVVLTGATSTAELFLSQRPRMRLFAETGGKNSAYVSPRADRELAIYHAVQSAFGHAGQKCSALSVLVLHEELFDDVNFKKALLDAARSLPVGSAWDLSSKVTPLIHPPSGPLREILENGEEYGDWLLRPQVNSQNPRLVSPGILWGVEPGSFPHQTEFFAPILSVVRAKSFDHAIEVMNGTPYGLTAGLFSLSESEQEGFVNRVQAGNLYINRGLTGAVVGRQPFGGWKASSFGPGAKAGSAQYVLQLTRDAAYVGDPEDRYPRRVKSYLMEKAARVSQVREGTEVVGEENYIRTVPGRTILLIGEEPAEDDIRAALLARRAAECQQSIVLVESNESLLQRSLFARDRDSASVATEAGLLLKIERERADRVRIVGSVSDKLLLALAQLGVSCMIDPVSDVGTRELAYFLSPQSISFASHRYGNVKMGSLSRLRWALERRNLQDPLSEG